MQAGQIIAGSVASLLLCLGCGGRAETTGDDGSLEAGRSDVTTHAEAMAEDARADASTTRLSPDVLVLDAMPDTSGTSGLEASPTDAPFTQDANEFGSLDASCPDAQSIIVDAGSFASCGIDPCGSGQFCADIGEGLDAQPEGHAMCFAIPEACNCVRTCQCVTTWAPLAGAIGCTDEGGVIVVSYKLPPHPVGK